LAEVDISKGDNQPKEIVPNDGKRLRRYAGVDDLNIHKPI